ncbi:Tn3 family transposase [Streptomyces sp. NPDC056638]|uniref:Tn3 family transposase n=1 Tax=Streptomyces sp. NPDC056638 TaxID=3345887 RepID=UPI00367D9A55
MGRQASPTSGIQAVCARRPPPRQRPRLRPLGRHPPLIRTWPWPGTRRSSRMASRASSRSGPGPAIRPGVAGGRRSETHRHRGRLGGGLHGTTPASAPPASGGGGRGRVGSAVGVDGGLIETHYRNLMRVIVSIREGTISSTLLLKRLRSGSRRNATYTAFRKVGRVIRTVQLLHYLSDALLRSRVTAATNKGEAFNGSSDWVRFGQRGTVAANNPVEQEKDVKFTSLLANLVIFHNTLNIADIAHELQTEGQVVDPLDLAQISPYLTEHIKRFGEYSTHVLGITPDDYDAHLCMDFSVLGEDEAAAAW